VATTGNMYPLIIFVVLSPLACLIAFIMPRKTAKGYSLHRQAKGLTHYIKKGKWRHEIAEKRMFFEEILPLAISLGVVGKLAKDMKNLGIRPPSYFSGTTNALIYTSLFNFENSVKSSLVAGPKNSSSWSGGSGFGGGGFSGGGFGGGGGGSW